MRHDPKSSPKRSAHLFGVLVLPRRRNNSCCSHPPPAGTTEPPFSLHPRIPPPEKRSKPGTPAAKRTSGHTSNRKSLPTVVTRGPYPPGLASISDSAICHQPRIAPDDMGASQYQPSVTPE